jgi:hypothetical protein
VRSLSTNKPIAVEYIAGISGTFDFNPTVRLYQMDAQYNVPLEFTAYRTQLEESNN